MHWSLPAFMESVLSWGQTYKGITHTNCKTIVTQEACGVASPRRSMKASLRKCHRRGERSLEGEERQDSAGSSLLKGSVAGRSMVSGRD